MTRRLGGHTRYEMFSLIPSNTLFTLGLQVTYPQGGVEQIFIDSMGKKGLHVEWDTVPISLETSEELSTPNTHAVKVRYSYHSVLLTI